MKPLFSVIVTVYNKANYIQRCIDSLLKQDFHNYELIIIDDGSTDGSYDICKSYVPHFDVVKLYRIKNGGVSNARNVGIQYSKGRWIVFVDGDDYVSPNLLHTIDSIIEDNKIICYCFANIIDGKQYPYVLPEKRITLHTLLEKYNTSSIIDFVLCTVFNKVYDAQIIKQRKIQFDISTSFGEDLIFNLNYLREIKEIVVLDDILYFYDNDVDNSGVKKVRDNYDEVVGLISKNVTIFTKDIDCDDIIKKCFKKDYMFKKWKYITTITINSVSAFKSSLLLFNWFRNMPDDIKEYSKEIGDNYYRLFNAGSRLTCYFRIIFIKSRKIMVKTKSKIIKLIKK